MLKIYLVGAWTNPVQKYYDVVKMGGISSPIFEVNIKIYLKFHHQDICVSRARSCQLGLSKE